MVLCNMKEDLIVPLALLMLSTSFTYTAILQPNFDQFLIHPYKSLLVHKNPKAYYLGVTHHCAVTAALIIYY